MSPLGALRLPRKSVALCPERPPLPHNVGADAALIDTGRSGRFPLGLRKATVKTSYWQPPMRKILYKDVNEQWKSTSDCALWFFK
jgi:hypothetical protein